jgi:hypothetical protein
VQKDETSFQEVWLYLNPALNATAEVLEGDVGRGVADALTVASDLLKAEHGTWQIPDVLVTAVSLAADLANAKDAQSIEAALQVGTAPLGSWRLKHSSPFSITLNGFVGASGGYERPLQGTGPDIRDGFGAGAMGAVGIDLTSGRCSACGVFFSVLDVGQLLTTPISPPSGQQSGNNPAMQAQASGDINIVQVLSPGAYVHVGLGESPFTLGAGATIAPLLRYYENEENHTKSPYTMVRVSAFLAVDLNLLPIYAVH